MFPFPTKTSIFQVDKAEGPPQRICPQRMYFFCTAPLTETDIFYNNDGKKNRINP